LKSSAPHKREPDIGFLGPDHARAQNSDDRYPPALKRCHPPDDGWIALKRARPEAIADDGKLRCVWDVFGLVEGAAKLSA
jgi:hypothetical protein